MPEPKSRRFEGRVAFLALLPAIRSEVERGVSLKSIYDTRKGMLGIGYRYFHQLVARHFGLARNRFADRVEVENPSTRIPARQGGAATSPPPPLRPEPSRRISSTPAPPNLDGPAPMLATPTEITDGPKAAPRPRSFRRFGGVADDNKDRLI